MRSNWIKCVALWLLAAVLLATPGLAVTIGGATVTGSDVRLRTSADTATNSNIITEMEKGTFLLVEGKQGAWYQVVMNGTEGYVSAAFANFSENADGTYVFDSTTNGTNVNLRAGASTSSSIVKSLKNTGSALKVTGVDGQWLKVTDAAGASGYIRSDLLRYKNSQSAVSAQQEPSTPGEQIAATAKLYYGYNYRWGGMSPSTGFDCSGFANYVCSENGISLHRVAQDIYNNDGVSVDRDALQPGDLLFFGYGPYSVTHMGIYIGDGTMIHASTSTTGVIYSDINSNYYLRMYVGAKRVV